MRVNKVSSFVQRMPQRQLYLFSCNQKKLAKEEVAGQRGRVGRREGEVSETYFPMW